MPENRVDPLDQTLDLLAELATVDDRQAIPELRSRVKDRRLRVLIAGEAKRGKSTLANRLAGQDVLPTGVVPVTAVTTTLRRQADDDAGTVLVRFDDGRLERHPLDALADYVTEQQNPHNAKQVRDVQVLLGAGPLDGLAVELVDTPGTGSVFEHNTVAARDARQGLDAAIFVLTTDPPVSAAERDLLAEVAAQSVHTVVFLNKADRLAERDLAEALEFTTAVCRDAAGGPVQVIAGSALAGATDPGFACLATQFEQYLRSHARTDVDIALRGHTQRLALSMLDAAVLTERTVQLTGDHARHRVRRFGEVVDSFQNRQAELDDRGWAAERGLRRGLDESAARLRGELTATCLSQVETALNGPLDELPVDEMYREGRELAIEVMRTAIDQWREDEAHVLENGLRDLCDRMATEQARQLAEIRVAAEELLGLSITVAAEPHGLDAGRAFWYAFEQPVGVEPPLASAARQVTPGKTRRARRRLLDELPELVDRQVGRARGDLQHRLQESRRTTLAGLRASHQQLLRRLGAALAEAHLLCEATDEDRRDLLPPLAKRVSQLSGVVKQLQKGADRAGTAG